MLPDDEKSKVEQGGKGRRIRVPIPPDVKFLCAHNSRERCLTVNTSVGGRDMDYIELRWDGVVVGGGHRVPWEMFVEAMAYASQQAKRIEVASQDQNKTEPG